MFAIFSTVVVVF